MELNEKKELVKSIVVSMVAGCVTNLDHETIVENAVDLMHEVDRTLEALGANDEEVDEEEEPSILEFTETEEVEDEVPPDNQSITPHEEENVTYERLEPESTGLMTPEQILTEMTQATFGNNNPLDEEQIAMMAILEEQANTPAPVTAIPDLITPSFPSAGTADTIPIEAEEEEDIEEDEDFEFDDEFEDGDDLNEDDDIIEDEEEVVQQAAPVVVDHRFDSYGWPEDNDPPIK